MEAGLMKGDRMPWCIRRVTSISLWGAGMEFPLLSTVRIWWASGGKLTSSLSPRLPWIKSLPLSSPSSAVLPTLAPAELSLSRICSGKLRFARSALQTLDQELPLCPHFWHRNEGCWFLSLSRSELIRLSGTFSHLLCLSGNCKQTEK